MEEQFQQVTNIINELAASNPYITKDQIAKARSMYNGDMRPLDEIRAELEAYSEAIMAQGLKREKGKELAAKKVEREEPKESEPAVEKEEEKVPQQVGNARIQAFPQTEPVEVVESLKVELPGEDKKRQLQSMIDDALGEASDLLVADNSHEQQQVANKDQAKVLVKTQNEQTPNTGNSASNESGYGNVTALLSLTIICSIVTIIIALLTMMAN